MMCTMNCGIRAGSLWAPVSLFIAHHTLQLYLVGQWKADRAGMEGPSPAHSALPFLMHVLAKGHSTAG